jgi:hypothetical protein
VVVVTAAAAAAACVRGRVAVLVMELQLERVGRGEVVEVRRGRRWFKIDSEVGSSVGKPTCPRMVTDDGVVHTLAFGNEVYNWTAGTIDIPPGTRTTMTGKGQYHTLFVMSGSVTCKFVEMEGFEGVLNDGGERKFPIMGEIRDGGCFRVNL